MGKPEWQDDLCDVLNKQSREEHCYIADSTYYIHSCENQHVTCIEQRIAPSIMVSTMAATYCRPHQVPENTKNQQKKSKIKWKNEWNRMIEKQYHDTPVLRLYFTDWGFLVVDRQFEIVTLRFLIFFVNE